MASLSGKYELERLSRIALWLPNLALEIDDGHVLRDEQFPPAAVPEKHVYRGGFDQHRSSCLSNRSRRSLTQRSFSNC